MSMAFTKAQHEAIFTHDRNLIVIAGAGSGKTRVLVERYMALLDANADWPLNALVAITFTKKAAEEMRDRVRRALEDRYNDADTEHDAQRWSQLLSEIDGARIDTIHGLCASLLRANAAEIGIDPEFDVLDEIEAAVLLEDVVDDVLAGLVMADSPIVELLVEYGPSKVRNALTDPALLNADLGDLPEDLEGLWSQWLVVETQQQVASFLAEVAAIGTVTPAKDDKLGDYWARTLSCLDRLHDLTDEDDPIELLKMTAMVDLRVGSAKKWGGKEELKEAKDSARAIRTAAQDVLAIIAVDDPEIERRGAFLTTLWHDLITQTQAAFIDAKQHNATLDFDDLERMTRELLTTYPAVVARYRGTEFKHLLVDEFQDTNDAQWEIVKALAGLDVPGSMFVVGDQKQSIYAFRGADVSVFGDVREEIAAAAGVSVQMAQSFRTHQRLVDGFNAIFEQLLVREEDSPVARFQVTLDKHMDAFRKPPPAAQVPSIEMLLIDQVQYDEDGMPLLNSEGKPAKLSADERRTWEAAEIATKINRIVAEQQPVHIRVDGEDTSRPIEYGDIAILMQSLKYVTVLEDALKQAEIPFVTVAGRGYYDRQEVWDLMNLLAALYNPSDNLALASALRSPMFGLSDDALFALRLQYHPEDEGSGRMLLWEAIANPGDLVPVDELDLVAFAQKALYTLQAIAGRVTISELLRAALEQTGYLAILTGLPDGARRRGNVEKLLEKAQTSGYITLSAFSQYLQDLSVREAREGEAALDVSGAVQIMSVHASKGLEFPLVMLADASWERSNTLTDPVIYDPVYGLCCRVYDPIEDTLVDPFVYRQIKVISRLRDEAERLRLLYVAMTRAKDYVVISGRVQYKDAEDLWVSGGWLGKLLEVLELEQVMQQGEHIHTYAWGDLRVTLPKQGPSTDINAASEAQLSAWEADTHTETPLKPPLMAALTLPRAKQIRHLSATQIAHLGSVAASQSAEMRTRYSEYFRRQVVQDAPTHLRELPDVLQRVSARQIGEIVHEALRHWYLPMNMPDDKLIAILESYAWRQGITSEMTTREAVKRAFQLLERFEVSPVYEWVNSARQVYKELPFVYEIDGYVIHGIIDLLLQTADDRWVIVDYKTGATPADHVKMAAQARQYHLQVGIYAQAVADLLGVMPATYIHFLQRAEHPIHVTEAEWRQALAQKLSHRIQELFEDVTS